MYTQKIQHRILTEIRDDFPYLKIGIRFNDYFTMDTYIFESSNYKSNLNRIPFSVYKNNELIKECALIDRNVDQFLNQIFEDINDHDLKSIFYTQHKERIIQEVQDFMDFYDNLILVKEITIEGELRRMKQMAGITKKIID